MFDLTEFWNKIEKHKWDKLTNNEWHHIFNDALNADTPQNINERDGEIGLNIFDKIKGNWIEKTKDNQSLRLTLQVNFYFICRYLGTNLKEANFDSNNRLFVKFTSNLDAEYLANNKVFSMWKNFLANGNKVIKYGQIGTPNQIYYEYEPILENASKFDFGEKQNNNEIEIKGISYCFEIKEQNNEEKAIETQIIRKRR